MNLQGQMNLAALAFGLTTVLTFFGAVLIVIGLVLLIVGLDIYLLPHPSEKTAPAAA